ADRLPRTPAGDAVEAALAAWDKRLRPSMRALSGGSPAEAEVAARRQEVLSELLALVRAVEAAASEQHGWREEEEVAACLALLQTLSDAALWCVVASEKEASGGAGAGDLLALRCQVLGRTVQAWECSDQLDFAHLRTVYMHYKARAQTLQLAPTDLGAARAAEAAARGKCESAFFVRFGISPVNLALGQADCVAEVLLKGLQAMNDQVAKQARVIKIQLESGMGVRIPVFHEVMPWAVRWSPLKRRDSERLERVVAGEESVGPSGTVPVECGRYDVDLRDRKLRAVYWDEPERSVLRSLWFHGRGGEALPYEEQDAEEIEAAFQRMRAAQDRRPLLVPVNRGCHDVRFEAVETLPKSQQETEAESKGLGYMSSLFYSPEPERRSVVAK
ncbi:unnamed protein product, partial [Prorocentrum cordatum]